MLEQQKELQASLTAERLEGIYIPRDLGECFVELDKMLAEVSRNEMRALPKREGMIEDHMGLGMGLRNSWGLWRGSRLQKYFMDGGVKHPDECQGSSSTTTTTGCTETVKDGRTGRASGAPGFRRFPLLRLPAAAKKRNRRLAFCQLRPATLRPCTRPGARHTAERVQRLTRTRGPGG